MIPAMSTNATKKKVGPSSSTSTAAELGPERKKQRLAGKSLAKGPESSAPEEGPYQKSVALVFGGALYSKLLGFAGPEGIAHFRGDEKWRRAMDRLPAKELRELKLPVVSRPIDGDLTRLRHMLTEPAENAMRGQSGWSLNWLGLMIHATSPLTSNKSLHGLIHSKADADILKSILERKDISSSVLTKLILVNTHSFDLYQKYEGIARHPNATTEILSAILSRLPNDLDRNALTPSEGGVILVTIASHKNTGLLDLDFLSRHGDISIREAVAMNPSASGLLSNLSCDDEAKVRMAVSFNRSAPETVLATLSIDQIDIVRRAVASNPRASIGILASLVEDDDSGVCLNLGINPKVNIDDAFSTDKESQREALAAYSKEEKTLQKLVTLDDEYHLLVAGNENAPRKVLASLASSSDPEVRYTVAENPNTCKETLEELFRNAGGCNFEIAFNKNTPLHLLGTLSKDEDAYVRGMVASNRSTPIEVLGGMLLEDESSEVIRRLCMNKNVPVDLINEKIERCVRDGETVDGSGFSGLLFRHDIKDGISVASLLALSKCSNINARGVAASNARLPLPNIIQFSQDKEVIESLLTNPLLQMAVDKLSHLLSDGGVASDSLFSRGETWW